MCRIDNNNLTLSFYFGGKVEKTSNKSEVKRILASISVKVLSHPGDVGAEGLN